MNEKQLSAYRIGWLFANSTLLPTVELDEMPQSAQLNTAGFTIITTMFSIRNLLRLMAHYM